MPHPVVLAPSARPAATAAVTATAVPSGNMSTSGAAKGSTGGPSHRSGNGSGNGHGNGTGYADPESAVTHKALRAANPPPVPLFGQAAVPTTSTSSPRRSSRRLVDLNSPVRPGGTAAAVSPIAAVPDTGRSPSRRATVTAAALQSAAISGSVDHARGHGASTARHGGSGSGSGGAGAGGSSAAPRVVAKRSQVVVHATPVPKSRTRTAHAASGGDDAHGAGEGARGAARRVPNFN